LKRRSDANSSSKPPEPPVFFLDRSLGKHVIASRLRATGTRVEVHDDHFPQDAQDPIWLQEVGARGWVVMTKDEKIRFRPAEKRALIAGGVAAFVLTARGDLTGAEMAGIFVAALPRLHRFLLKHRPPFMAGISRAGQIKMLM
jgi:hypothetical protein